MSHTTNIEGGGFLKRMDWTVYRFKRELVKKEEGGVSKDGWLVPQCTLRNATQAILKIMFEFMRM